MLLCCIYHASCIAVYRQNFGPPTSDSVGYANYAKISRRSNFVGHLLGSSGIKKSPPRCVICVAARDYPPWFTQHKLPLLRKKVIVTKIKCVATLHNDALSTFEIVCSITHSSHACQAPAALASEIFCRLWYLSNALFIISYRMGGLTVSSPRAILSSN